MLTGGWLTWLTVMSTVLVAVCGPPTPVVCRSFVLTVSVSLPQKLLVGL